MRCFIALELPERFTAEIGDVARQLSAVVDGRFMKRETYHLTLAFLGDIGQGEVDCVITAMEQACAERPPIPIQSDGLGKFGKARDATLWLGLKGNEELADLASSLRDALSTEGVPFDQKPFKPHVTLARRANIPKGNLPALVFPEPAEAQTVTLFKSELSREGATYKPLYQIQLG